MKVLNPAAAALAAFVMLLCSCASSQTDPYAATLCTLTVCAEYPDGYRPSEGARVSIEDVNLGSSYVRSSDASGCVSAEVPAGLYRISVTDRDGADIFNGNRDNVRVTSDTRVSVSLSHSRAGSIVIKEIYCGGCMKTPEEGTYQSDQYVILHNNDVGVQYLDGLCFGTLCPYNSNSNNPFLEADPVSGESALPDFLPIIQAVWQFGGDGQTFPLQSGEDAVLCLRGAIDHSKSYPLSVNLDRSGYFVCYNSTYFTNTTYHPAPGVNIAQDRILDVVVKTGQANAYTFSINSPTAVLFRAPEGMTMREYVQQEGAIVQVPGSSVDKVVKVSPDSVVDAVEVFNGSSTNNTKRLLPSLDAGYVSLSGTFLGHSLMRRLDEELTASSGYEVYCDTNNSSEDFYERQIQSLHEEE